MRTCVCAAISHVCVVLLVVGCDENRRSYLTYMLCALWDVRLLLEAGTAGNTHTIDDKTHGRASTFYYTSSLKHCYSGGLSARHVANMKTSENKEVNGTFWVCNIAIICVRMCVARAWTSLRDILHTKQSRHCAVDEYELHTSK